MSEVTIKVPTGTKSWKTTLFGAVTALGMYLAQQEGLYAVVGQILVVVGPVLMGLFSKDANVTGGSVVEAAPEVK